jgi:hypothetical protein
MAQRFALSGNIYLAIKLALTKAAGVGQSQAKISYDRQMSWTYGVGRLMAQQMYDELRTLGAGEEDNLLLQNSTLEDAFGAPLDLTSLKIICIEAGADNDGSIEIGGGVDDVMTGYVKSAGDTICLNAGGMLYLQASDASGWEVSDTSRYLRILNTGTRPATYQIILVGCNA